MPLRITNGKAIVPAPPPLGARVLNVAWIKQEQTQWCWAACAEMVLGYHGNLSVRQCDLANWLFGLSDCCTVPSSSLCNRPCQVADVCRVYNAFGVRCHSGSGTISQGAIRLELDQDRPVEPGIAWNGGGGHVVVVRGYYDDGKVHVNDPWQGSGAIIYADLVQAYGMGSWFWTFTDLGR
jgi:hypothetical protein